jgi:hypothetical protein
MDHEGGTNGMGGNPVLGTWKLRSYTRKDAETGELSNPLGVHPVGYINYSPDGRMMGILVGDKRRVPSGIIPTESEVIALFKTMVAYAGTYTIDDNRITHNVDASWNEAWTGTQQTRFYKVDGSILTLTTALSRSGLGAPMGVSTLVWERVEFAR